MTINPCIPLLIFHGEMRTSWKVLGLPPGRDRHTVSLCLRGKSSHVSPPRPTPSFPPCPAVPQQAYKPCSCPVSRPKKAPRVNNTDIAGLMDGGLTHWEQGPGVTLTLTVLPRQQVLMGSFAPRGRGRLSVTGATEPDGLIGCQGNQQRGRPLTAPLIRTITRRTWDKSRWKEGQVSGWTGGKPWWSQGGTESKRTTIFSGQNLWTRGRGDLPGSRPPSFN